MMDIPEQLQNLPANGGIYAVWMVFQHYGVDLEINDLVKLCRHNEEEGTSTISLAVALQQLGLNVSFYTDPDLDLQPTEQWFYQKAAGMNISIEAAIEYDQILQATEQGKFVIAYYDTLEGVGNHSLIYSADLDEVCFFDSFDAMPVDVFEQQRQVEGICRQVIIIDDRDFIGQGT